MAVQHLWPLVGRAQELELLLESLDPGAGVLLAGHSGVGKTRLSHEVASRAAETGWRVEVAVATELTQPMDYGALAHLARSTDDGPSNSWPQRILGAMRAAAAGHRVLLVVDDVHLLDEASASVIHALVANRVTSVVMTVRSGQAVPSPIASLYGDGRITRLELQHLSRAEVDELVETVLDGPVLTDSVDRLWALTDGNVLYLHELVLDAMDTGALKLEGGFWRWQGSSPVGNRLGELVGARLRSADRSLQRFLAIVALGETLSDTVVSSLAPGVDIAEVERRGLVKLDRSAAGVRLRLAHPLYGEVIRAALTVADRRNLCSSLAESLGHGSALTAAEALQVAQLRLMSGTSIDAVLLAEAAEEANRRGDPALALSLADASLAAKLTPAGLLQRAAALVSLGDFDDGVSVLAELGSWELDDQSRKAVAYQQLKAIHFGLGQTDRALAALAEAEEQISGDSARAAVAGWRAGILASAGRIREAAAAAEPLLASGDARVRASALSVMAADRLRIGRPAESVRLAREARDCERSRASASADLLLLIQESIAHMAAGAFKPAGEVVEEARRSASSAKSEVNAGTALVLQGRFELAVGRPATGGRLLRDGVALLAGHDAGGYLAWGLALMAEAHAVMGDRGAAEEAAARSRDLPEAGALLLRPDTRRAQRWAASKPPAALADLAHELVAAGDLMVAVHALHDSVRLGSGPRTCSELSRLAGEVEGELAVAIALQAEGIARGDIDRLEKASELFYDMGTSLLAAETAALAAGLAQRHGLRVRASAATRRATELAMACEGAATPPLAAATASHGMTRREREIAVLAARGMTNKEIALHLSTSVRTVEGHLYQVFAKLGLNSRRDLDMSVLDRFRE